MAPYRPYGTDAPFLAAAGSQGVVLTDFHGGTRIYAAVAAAVCA